MTDKKQDDAEKRQADREAVAAKGKERAETEPVEQDRSETEIGNGRRFGTKVSDEG